MKCLSLTGIGAALWLLAACAQGADLDKPTLTVSGHAKRQVMPTVARAAVMIGGKGKTIEDALAQLASRQEAAKAKLAKLDPAPASVKLGSPKIQVGGDERQQRIQQLLRERLRNGRKPDKSAKGPESVAVSGRLTAEWPLREESPQKLLVFYYQLGKKLEDLDLADKKNEKLTPEEQELLEEAGDGDSADPFGGVSSAPSMGGRPQSGVLLMVAAKVSQEQRDKLMAEAFQDAKKRGERLAKIAGATLGPLLNLTESTSFNPVNPYAQSYGSLGYERSRYIQQTFGDMPFDVDNDEDSPGEVSENETVGMAPDLLTINASISAAFEIKK